MALGDNTLQAARGNQNPGRNPYMVQTVLNWATALSDKGSALAASDVVPVIAVPTSAAAVVAQNPAAYQPVMAVADDNIDVTIATLSGGAVSSGKFRVWAVLMDCSDMGNDGVANEVTRDYLA